MTSQNVRYQFSNHLGSASLELDETGTLITYEEYYPYGSTSFQMGPDAATVSRKRYRYTGKERDEGTGFYYHGARYYIPWLARWAAVDPLEAKYAPESTYCYAHNNPVRFTDSTGMGSKDKTKTTTPATTPMDCFQAPSPAVDNTRAPSVIPTDSEPAKDQEQANLFNNVKKYTGAGKTQGSGGTKAEFMDASLMNRLTPQQKAEHEQKRLQMLENVGYNADGTPKLLTSLKNSREFNSFAEKVFVATDIATLGEGGAALVRKGLSMAGKNLAAKQALVMVGNGGEYVSKMKIVREIQKGEKISEIVASAQMRTYSTGVEHAVVRLGINSEAPGARVLVSGGPHGITFEPDEVVTIFGHTHPSVTGASKADYRALEILNQSKQYIYEGFNEIPLVIRKNNSLWQ